LALERWKQSPTGGVRDDTTYCHSTCRGTRYEVLCIIDKRCRVQNYVGGEAVYIHVAQGLGLCSCHDNTES